MAPGEHYVLFRFSPTALNLYGWIQLSVAASPLAGSNPAYGPTVTIEQWAYDDTGAKIAAGAVPEPGTFLGTGLAALALGAAGWRRRKAKP